MQTAIWSVPAACALAYAPVFIRGYFVVKYGKADNTKPRDTELQTAKMPPHIKDLTVRLRNSHLNQLETLGFYAAGVAVAVAVKVPPETLSMYTSLYLKSRFAFNLAYAGPQVAKGILRSLAWGASLVSAIMVYAAAANTVANS